MINLDFDINQWYNEDDLDYRTPGIQRFDSRAASPADQSQHRKGRPGLPLLQLDDWDPNLPYDESLPTCIHYSIEWKLLLNKGRLVKLTNDTEQNLVLAPGSFWSRDTAARRPGAGRVNLAQPAQTGCSGESRVEVICSVSSLLYPRSRMPPRADLLDGRSRSAA